MCLPVFLSVFNKPRTSECNFMKCGMDENYWNLRLPVSYLQSGYLHKDLHFFLRVLEGTRYLSYRKMCRTKCVEKVFLWVLFVWDRVKQVSVKGPFLFPMLAFSKFFNLKHNWRSLCKRSIAVAVHGSLRCPSFCVLFCFILF